MATIKGSQESRTTNTVAIKCVDAPVVGTKRHVTSLRVNNRDSGSINVRVEKKVGSEVFVVSSDAALAVAGTHTATDVVLSDQDSTLQVVLGGTPTTEGDITASFEDITQ